MTLSQQYFILPSDTNGYNFVSEEPQKNNKDNNTFLKLQIRVTQGYYGLFKEYFFMDPNLIIVIANPEPYALLILFNDI